MALATIVEKKGGWGKREMRPTADESLGRCRMCDARARQLKVGVSLRESVCQGYGYGHGQGCLSKKTWKNGMGGDEGTMRKLSSRYEQVTN